VVKYTILIIIISKWVFFRSYDATRNSNYRSLEKYFLQCLHAPALSLVAVDEAHCIREWLVDSTVRIYSFTREVCEGWVFCFQGLKFHNLGNLRALTKAPFMALTATAAPVIMQEITTSLLLRQPVTVQLGLNRPNIYLSVGKKINGLFL